jgi:hypothetical protein
MKSVASVVTKLVPIIAGDAAPICDIVRELTPGVALMVLVMEIGSTESGSTEKLLVRVIAAGTAGVAESLTAAVVEPPVAILYVAGL